MKNISSEIITDLLCSMRGAVDNIQTDAQQKGFTDDVNDAGAVLDFLANYSMDQEDYALLYANSAVIEECSRHVQRYGDAEQSAEAAKLAMFDYNA